MDNTNNSVSSFGWMFDASWQFCVSYSEPSPVLSLSSSKPHLCPLCSYMGVPSPTLQRLECLWRDLFCNVFSIYKDLSIFFPATVSELFLLHFLGNSCFRVLDEVFDNLRGLINFLPLVNKPKQKYLPIQSSSSFFVHSYVHWRIQHIFIECLHCARYSPRD